MKRNFIIFLFSIVGSFLFSCKKDSKQTEPTGPSVISGLVSFSANGQLVDADIDTTHKDVSFVLGNAADFHKVTINFTLANNVTAKINGSAVQSGSLIDFTRPVTLKLTSRGGKQSVDLAVAAQTELQYFGVAGNIVARKSLNRSYNFYMDQYDGTQFEDSNCGPASSSMAIKWADSTFTGTPGYARTFFRPGGEWWQTGDVSGYLNKYYVSNGVDTLGDVAAVVKKEIDAGNSLILCLDMFYVPQNITDYQHTQKFYLANTVGWGHFILIKGYIQTSNGFYLEAYDPYSAGRTYGVLTPGQFKGQDRYYLDGDIKLATMKWWPYAITVAPKGKKILSVRGLTTFSIHSPVRQARGR